MTDKRDKSEIEPLLASGAVRCRAHNKAGRQCGSPAIKGGSVCRLHGAAAPQVKRKAALRLLELVDPAIATLAREMATADRSSDRQAAANSILDRAGYGRVTKIDGADARAMLVERLLAIQAQTGTPAA